MSVQVRVDRQRCQGHNRCMTLAPGIFEADDRGQAVVLRDGDLGPDEERAARLAAENCPERAIRMFVEEGSWRT